MRGRANTDSKMIKVHSEVKKYRMEHGKPDEKAYKRFKEPPYYMKEKEKHNVGVYEDSSEAIDEI